MPNPLTAILTAPSAPANGGTRRDQTDDTAAPTAFSDVLEEVGLSEEQDIDETPTQVLPEAEEVFSEEGGDLGGPSSDTDEEQIQFADSAAGQVAAKADSNGKDGDLRLPHVETSGETTVVQPVASSFSERPATAPAPATAEPSVRPEPVSVPQSPQIFEHAFRLRNAQPAKGEDRMPRLNTEKAAPIEAHPVELTDKKAAPIEPAKRTLPLAQNPAAPALAPSPEMFESHADSAQNSEGEWGPSIKETPALQATRDLNIAQMINTARADTARAIAGQMAAAISAKPGSGAIEIALNPEELGRVSIILNGREDGFQLTIATERPETLDLMRRHLSVLSAEFQKLGYSDLSFDLGMSNDSGMGEGDSSHEAPSHEALPIDEAEMATPSPRTGPDRGLDMRL